MILHILGSTAKFMPNSYVFPGGIIDPTDFKFPIEKTNFDKINQNSIINLGLENDFSLRICAVREMFEESGLLLITDKEGKQSELLSIAENKDLFEWRKKIIINPNLFSQLFSINRKMDIASLIPWANWLTPFGEFHKRFNTIFFILPIFNCPKVIYCINEMINALWDEIIQIIEKGVNGKVSLPPPQFYELSRLQLICKNIEQIKHLKDFTNINRITPHIFKIEGYQGIHINILPGDYLYNNSICDFKPTTTLSANELLPPYTKKKNQFIEF
ncbi:Nudix hydrolase domain-containing protein [Meloidogyne graminicola]|uniref:Nudix hydrolase domain-containing protein n=1 Tax=Meloidogyne graminicola TaxID=189291 RepID=A0A8S9ZWG5_9BILA|nr:Nudix hydrolase domain-containing protein [Meloidogyne graminicola]